MLNKPLPPNNLNELMERAHRLSGLTFGQLADLYNIPVPNNPLYAKGWMGQLLEYALGATAQSRSVPDFEHLDIELKTLPVSLTGHPKESTFVCTALIPSPEKEWTQSRAYRKLSKVLWILIESDRLKPIRERRIGQAIYWTPSPDQMLTLKADWEELTEKINLGRFDELSALHGTYLQLRPKASTSQVLIEVINQEGQLVKTVPKGFYLRSQLTKAILASHFKTETLV